MTTKLDRSKPYQQSLGHKYVHFLQNGRCYNQVGEEIDSNGKLVTAKPAPVAVEPEPQSELGPANSRLALLVEAIGKLTEDQFTTGGMPKVEELEKIVGFDITAKDRDNAFTLFKGAN